MTSDRTEQVFSATAVTYDPARARLIPCFDRFYASAVDLIPPGTEHILDLGAGTGLLSAFIRGRFPTAQLNLIDNSEPMLAQARTRFAGDTNVTFELADYTATKLASSHFHAIVSALSIHHLADQAKQQLFLRIFAALKPGGIFVNAEQILQPTMELERAARTHWLAEVRALGASEQQITDSLLRQTEDRCATIDDQLVWLRQAHFADARCVFAQGRFAVLCAQRSNETR